MLRKSEITHFPIKRTFFLKERTQVKYFECIIVLVYINKRVEHFVCASVREHVYAVISWRPMAVKLRVNVENAITGATMKRFCEIFLSLRYSRPSLHAYRCS